MNRAPLEVADLVRAAGRTFIERLRARKKRSTARIRVICSRSSLIRNQLVGHVCFTHASLDPSVWLWHSRSRCGKPRWRAAPGKILFPGGKGILEGL